MPPEAAVRVEGVSKIQGERLVLRNASLTAAPGSLSLILGANGAGKSTFLRIIAGLSRPDSGAVNLGAGARLVCIGHATYLYPNLTALENLAFQAKIHGLKLARADLMLWLEKAGLAAHAHEPARIFSRGMAQRLNFCRALMLAPDIFLLDEPFTGMDAPSQAAMRAELLRLRDAGACLILVSHAPQADAPLANAVYELRRGQLEARPC